MATKDKILKQAQCAANRTKEVMVIQQSKNGQWLYHGFSMHGLLDNGRTAEVVKPQ